MSIEAVLFSEMTPGADWEDRFNAWYDREHIPIRMNVDGFIGAQRFRRTDGHGFLAIYDLKDTQVLSTPQYQDIKQNPSEETAWMLRSVTGFTRYTGRQIGWQSRSGVSEAALLASPYVYSVLFTVPSEREAEFNDWYDSEHVPLLLDCEQWLGCRRYRIVDGAPDAFTHLAIHHLQDLSALESPARAAARATEWRAGLAAEPWFQGTYATFARHNDRFVGVSAK